MHPHGRLDSRWSIDLPWAGTVQPDLRHPVQPESAAIHGSIHCAVPTAWARRLVIQYSFEMVRAWSRRKFLRQVAWSGTALAAPAILTRSGRAAERPNILFSIADDQSYPHAGAYGARFISTPGFDRVASEGVLFRHAFVSSPSCCPSRGSILTGQPFYRLREASMNHTIWPGGIPVYPDLLAEAGYHVGYTGKGWGPGNWKVSGRKYSPAGPAYNELRTRPPGRFISDVDYAGNFRLFLDKRPKGAPFCFWVGFSEPHRPYEEGIGVRHGKRLEDVQVPGFLPDDPVVRSDLADYAFEIEYYDQHLRQILQILEKIGELANTLIVVTADNGMPFPRAKATLYDFGTRMPLAIRWGERVKAGRVVDQLVSFTDFAPTFLEAAGLPIPEEMTGRSLLGLLAGEGSGPGREFVVFGLERHFPGARPGGAGYPMRAIRTQEFLYIRNYTPEASPMGDHPGPVWPEDDPTGGYGDTDGSPTKTFLWRNRDKYPELFRAAFERRPGEELYRVREDPFNLKNLAEEPALAGKKRELARQLEKFLQQTGDPRATGQPERFDEIMRRFPTVASGG